MLRIAFHHPLIHVLLAGTVGALAGHDMGDDGTTAFWGKITVTAVQQESVVEGHPNYDDMGPALAEAARAQEVQIEQRFRTLGALKSLAFAHVAPNGRSEERRVGKEC